MYKTAPLLFARLTEVEKLVIRAASEGTIEWLFHARYKREIVGSEAASLKVFNETIRLIQEDHRAKASADSFGLTWKF